MKLFVNITLLFFLYVGQASADCVYQGKEVSTGTLINGLECQEDGSWKKAVK